MIVSEAAAVVAAQGLVAAGMVEAVIRLWRVEAPEQALHLRRLALVLPVLVPAAIWATTTIGFFPARLTLFDVRLWLNLTAPGGVRLWAAAAAVAAITIGFFIAQEALPVLIRHREEIRAARRYRTGEFPALDAALADASIAFGGLALPVWIGDDGGPVACVAGPWRPRLLVSRRLLALLPPRELAAAVAHETAHVLREDLWLGWAWFVVRAVQCFSPAALLVFRWTLQDQERACDRVAAERIGDREALASALRRVHAGTAPPPARGAVTGHLARMGAAWENRLVTRRMDDLLRAERPAPLPWWRWRMAAAAAAVGGVLAFIR